MRPRRDERWLIGQNKRKRAVRPIGPFPSARAAVENIATTKNFSSRINYSAFKKAMEGRASFDGLGLEIMRDEGDEKQDDKEDDAEDDKEADQDGEDDKDDEDDDDDKEDGGDGGQSRTCPLVREYADFQRRARTSLLAWERQHCSNIAH